LQDIVLIAIATILSGAEGCDDIERYGKAKQEWLKSFLALPYGIPSHDTFNRFFSGLEPSQVGKSLSGLGIRLGILAGSVQELTPRLDALFLL
jgi:hypothetical protein